MGFTPCKAEQPLQGMELQEKEAQKKLKYTENLFRKNLQLIGVCRKTLDHLDFRSKEIIL